MKLKLLCAAMLLLATPAHAYTYTVTIKCNAKAAPTQAYVARDGDLLEAIKQAVDKAEKAGWVSGDCISVNATPKPLGMYGCSTKSCPPGLR